jgi:hypothetical protein
MPSNSLVTAVLSLAISCSVILGESQAGRRGSEAEQSSFATEELPGQPRVQRPLSVPGAVLQKLKSDDIVDSCLRYNPLTPGQSLDSWFIASEIHLDGPTESDLIIVPSFKGEESMCFHSVAGIGTFWLFRKNGNHYELVLRASGNSLEVLGTRNAGYRNIQTVTAGEAGRYITKITYKFDGRQYKKAEEATRKWQPPPRAN